MRFIFTATICVCLCVYFVDTDLALKCWAQFRALSNYSFHRQVSFAAPSPPCSLTDSQLINWTIIICWPDLIFTNATDSRKMFNFAVAPSAVWSQLYEYQCQVPSCELVCRKWNEKVRKTMKLVGYCALLALNFVLSKLISCMRPHVITWVDASGFHLSALTGRHCPGWPAEPRAVAIVYA